MIESSAPSNRLFLGVSRSSLGRAWRDRLDPAGEARARAIAQSAGAGDLVARVLAGRGIAADGVAHHLDPTLRALMPDPLSLADMGAAVERLAYAVTRGETVAIFGDYDVDGAASSALLADYFTQCGVPYLIHIPDRIFEGYGPNKTAIDTLQAAGAKLLVTVDCGTMSHAPLAHARAQGLDTIVLDHHQATEALPAALVVNPNRLDDLSGLGQLCAAGVAFMTLVALSRRLRAQGFFETRAEPDLLAGLDLVALATVADVAPLTGLNRAFVSKGLAVMRARGRPGLRALFDIARADGPPRPYHLGFLIGPRINAGGRIGDAALGAKLLSLTDEAEVQRIAQELDRLNRERQTLEKAIVEEAEAQALAHFGLGKNDGAAVVVSAEGWHPGVVGLVAARLKEKFRRPAFAIAFDGPHGTGSGRSIAGIDLGRVVRAAVEAGLLVKGGGHAMAAGITIERARLDDFRYFLETELADPVGALRQNEALYVDAALTAGGAQPDLLAALERAGPYGAGNPEPVFVFPAHRLVDLAPVGTDHLRLAIRAGDGAKLEGIAFRAAGEPIGAALEQARGQTIHLAGTLALDRWGGRERVKLRLLDLAPAAQPQG